MTIQSLCSAIRSQLCFSQVSSWVDLLKKAIINGGVKEQIPNLFSAEIMQNPRLKKNLQTMQVDLDILFRIKCYDGTSCFNDKPNVHMFPDTHVSDRLALRVGLKSLPRLDKIPTLNTEKANINGFSCDNRIKTSLSVPVPMGSPVAGSSCHLMSDRIGYNSCHETGKHRCKEEDEIYFDVDESIKQESPTTSNCFTPPQKAHSSLSPTTNQSSHLSHRERQLLKYKKRLMKRDKQKKKVQDGDLTSVSSLNTSSSEDFEKFQETAINAHFEPLYGTGRDDGDKNTSTVSQQPTQKTLSVGTQTCAQTEGDTAAKCTDCGEKMQCWNCDKNQNNIRNQKPSSSTANMGSVVGTMIGNKSDLLLQAIQRTADAHLDNTIGIVTRDKDNMFSSKIHQGDSTSADLQNIDVGRECDIAHENNHDLINNNNSIDAVDKSIAHLEMDSDCRLCKRQKTRHNYNTSMSVSSNSSAGSYRRTMSECLVGVNSEELQDELDGEMNCSSLLVHNCDDFNYMYGLATTHTDDSLAYGELKAYRRAFSEDVINQLPSETCCFESNEEDVCITIKCSRCKANKTALESPTTLKLTPNVTLQQVFQPTKNPIHQKIPKINLSQVFDSIQDDSGIGHDTLESSDNAFNPSPASSYPPSTMLSPRLPNAQSLFLKRRSRHMSDRSSISESNISDEEDEILKVAIEPADKFSAQPNTSSSRISSLYKKFVTKTHAAFNKFPLLGTMEESLLRDRFQPKAIVSGFKLLLGASGNFCPTQLTIPAQTFFYEFQGMKHMSTPYVVSQKVTKFEYFRLKLNLLSV